MSTTDSSYVSSTTQDNGGPAFPAGPFAAQHAPGMALRDWLASHAPISFDAACVAFGGEPDLFKDADRAAFFAVWSMLRYEFADAMLDERNAK